MSKSFAELGDGIRAWVALRQRSDTQYDLVLRWFLGVNENARLPGPDDKFTVKVQERNSKRWLHCDGTFKDDEPSKEQTPSCSPQKFVMLAPPQEEIEAEYHAGLENTRSFLTFTRPTAPIDPSCSADDNQRPANGFGVYHLLCETNGMRQMARTTALCLEPMRRVFDERKARLRGFPHLRQAISPYGEETSDEETLVRLAMHFSHALAHGLQRPRAIREGFVRYAKALNQGRTEIINPLEPLRMQDSLFAIGDNSAAAISEYSVIIGGLMRDEKLVDAIHKVVAEASNGRANQRLGAFTGGKLIDFWCSGVAEDDPCAALPESPDATCDDAARGKIYSAAHLLAQGMTLGPFDKGLVETWRDDQERLDIVIEGKNGFLKVSEWTLDGGLSCKRDDTAGWFLTEELTRDPEGFCTCVLPSDIERALGPKKSSRPIQEPKWAQIDYDMRRIEGDLEKSENDSQPVRHPQYGYGTGEAQVKIRIAHPDKQEFELCMPGCTREEKRTQQTVFAFNIYGMWENDSNNDSNKALFENEGKDPPPKDFLTTLKPWLITRRYSYELELKPGLSGAEDHLDEALENPPWEPHFLTPEVMREEDPKTGKLRTIPNPDKALPNEDPQTTFLFDLRSGMDSGKKDGRFVGWDPQFWIKDGWSPRRDRDADQDGTGPQRYRFWVTSVDAFDQESEPVPVRANDADGGEPESYLFTPRFRTPMLPPILLEHAPQSSGNNDDPPPTRGLKYVSQPNRALELRWFAPRHSGLGTTGSNSANDTVVPAEELTFEYVVFRRLLRRKVDGPAFGPEALFFLDQARDLGLSAQWDQVIERLARDDWEIWGDNHAANCSPTDRGCIVLEAPGRQGNPDQWLASFALEPEDLGFEYIAGVAAKIDPNAEGAAFWAPDADARKVRIADPQDGLPTRPEIVRSSNVAETSPLPVPNAAEPRGPEAESLNGELLSAEPVLPPAPEIDRDWVLSRLVTMNFSRNGTDPLPKTHWKDTGYLLTEGQKMVCETALGRIAGLPGAKLTQDQLHAMRRLMVEDFGAEIDTNPGASEKQVAERLDLHAQVSDVVYRQHKSIGFRGVQKLKWRYIPNLTNPLSAGEAEAMMFRIHWIRVSIDHAEPDTLGNPGTASSDNAKSVVTPTGHGGTRVGRAKLTSRPDAVTAVYEIDVPAEQEANLSAIAREKVGAASGDSTPANMPSLARIDTWKASANDPDKTTPIFATVQNDIRYEAVTRSGKALLRTEIELRLEPGKDSAALPKEALVRIYKADEVNADNRVVRVDTDAPKTYALAFPVGGGRREIYCWWVGTSSAQDKETGNERRLSIMKRMQETIVPDPPTNFQAFEPFDEAYHDIEFPGDATTLKWLKQFLPKEAHLEKNEEIAPRVILAWGNNLPDTNGPPAPDHYFVPDDQLPETRGIIIHREWRKAKPDNPSSVRGAELRSRTPWQALNAINEAKDLELLAKSDLDLLKPWLEGGVIRNPQENPQGEDPGDKLGLLVKRAEPGLKTGYMTVAGMKPVAVNVPDEEGKDDALVKWRAGFVDLFQDHLNEDGTPGDKVMDMNREYRYWAQAYVDLKRIDPDGDIPETHRYLKSDKTAVTGWTRPSRTPLALGDPDCSRQLLPDINLPEVRFRIFSELNEDCAEGLKTRSAAATDNWSFRVTIKRKFPFVLRADPTVASEEAWGAIADSVDFEPHECAEIVDRGLERDEWDAVLEASYLISVKQFLLEGEGREQLIGSLEKRLDKIELAAPQDGEEGEYQYVCKITIR